MQIVKRDSSDSEYIIDEDGERFHKAVHLSEVPTSNGQLFEVTHLFTLSRHMLLLVGYSGNRMFKIDATILSNKDGQAYREILRFANSVFKNIEKD